MRPRRAIEAAIDLVPSWFVTNVGNTYDITVAGETVRFGSLRRLTPALADLLLWIRTDLQNIIHSVEPFPEEVGVDLIQEYFAERWLRETAGLIDWRGLFDYSRGLSHRTYENAEISFNFVIRPTSTGTVSVTEPGIQKIIDPLCSSRWTYFLLDPRLRLCAYDEVRWASIDDRSEYKFHPEFLHPYFTLLQAGDWSVHKTPRGDLVILNAEGLAAARRKGRWKIYDAPTLKNALVDIVGEYRVGANLFEIVFDLKLQTAWRIARV